jgi:hypothetical protein
MRFVALTSQAINHVLPLFTCTSGVSFCLNNSFYGQVQDEKRTWDRAYIKAVSNKVVRQNRKDKSRLPRSNTNDDMVGASGNNLANSI